MTTLAVRLMEPFVVHTLEGRAQARAGDWLAQGAGGEAWPITDEVFRTRYAVGDDDTPL